MMNFIFRVILLLLGLVFAASLAVVVMLLAAVWGVRYAWGRLTGKPVTPMGDALQPAQGFDRFRHARSRPSPRRPTWPMRGRAASGGVGSGRSGAFGADATNTGYSPPRMSPGFASSFISRRGVPGIRRTWARCRCSRPINNRSENAHVDGVLSFAK
jgi:hypothetical protein